MTGSAFPTPCSIEAEKSLLGALITYPVGYTYKDIVSGIVADDFSLHAHKLIYQAINDLRRKGSSSDLIVLTEQLKSANHLDDIGGAGYLNLLSAAAAPVQSIPSHSAIVRRKAVLRKLITACGSIAEECLHSDLPMEDLLSKAAQAISGVKLRLQEELQLEPVSKALAACLNSIQRKYTGDPWASWKTGFHCLDEMTSGFHPGELVIAAGRPAMGKTCFALSVACLSPSSSEHPVALFSLGIGRRQMGHRLISMLGGIDSGVLRSGMLEDEDWQAVTRTMRGSANRKLFIDYTQELDPDTLLHRASKLKQKHGIGLVIVDYLQLMRSSGNAASRSEEIAEITRSLKLIARKLDAPVLALSQLSRRVESRRDKHPHLADLSGSGVIEEVADQVLLLYRDEYYHRDNPALTESAEIIVAKNPNGPTGSLRLRFSGKHLRFENLTHEPLVEFE